MGFKRFFIISLSPLFRFCWFSSFWFIQLKIIHMHSPIQISTFVCFLFLPLLLQNEIAGGKHMIRFDFVLVISAQINHFHKQKPSHTLNIMQTKCLWHFISTLLLLLLAFYSQMFESVFFSVSAIHVKKWEMIGKRSHNSTAEHEFWVFYLHKHKWRW